MVRSVAGNLPEQVKNNQSVNTAAGNGGQKMSQYSWFTVYPFPTQQVRFFLVRINHGMMVQCEGHSIPLKNGKFF